MFQCCDKVLKVLSFLQHNKFRVAFVSFMASETLEYGQVAFHVIPCNNQGWKTPFLNENRGGFWESFVAMSLLLNHKRRCSQEGGGRVVKFKEQKPKF